MAAAEEVGTTEEAGGTEEVVPLEVVGDFKGGGAAEDEATSVSDAGGKTEEVEATEEEDPGGGLEGEGEGEEWFGTLFRE